MKITVNKKREEYPEDSLSIRQLLERKGWNFPLLIVRVNGALVKRENYDSATVEEGADVDLCHLVSGG